MKNTAKLIVAGVFALGALFAFLSSNNFSRTGATVFSASTATPTPAKNTNSAPSAAANLAPVTRAANSNASTFPFGHPAASPGTVPANLASNTVAANTSPGGKKIPKSFTLGQNSLSEHGDVAFNHENHAYKNYSVDGKSVLGCVECHHTDQPKPKSPLVTSERNEVLTDAVYQRSSQKVSTCRSCHFQDGEVPEGKEMPVFKGTDQTNQEAYHRNCNVCHDDAASLRPEIKKKPGFATTNDCLVCHKKNT